MRGDNIYIWEGWREEEGERKGHERELKPIMCSGLVSTYHVKTFTTAPHTISIVLANHPLLRAICILATCTCTYCEPFNRESVLNLTSLDTK